MTTTTCIGTWCNYGDNYSTSVESTVADFLNGGTSDWREAMDESGAVDRIVEDYRAAVDAALPEGVSLCGNEFIADIDAEFDTQTDIIEAIEAIDVWEIVARHDVDRDV